MCQRVMPRWLLYSYVPFKYIMSFTHRYYRYIGTSSPLIFSSHKCQLVPHRSIVQVWCGGLRLPGRHSHISSSLKISNNHTRWLLYSYVLFKYIGSSPHIYYKYIRFYFMLPFGAWGASRGAPGPGRRSCIASNTSCNHRKVAAIFLCAIQMYCELYSKILFT